MKTYVVGYCFSPASDAAAAFAFDRAHSEGARVRVVFGVAQGSWRDRVSSDELREIESQFSTRLRSIVEKLADGRVDLDQVSHHVVFAAAAQALESEAAQFEHSRIVIGLQKSKLERALPGRTSQRVLRTASSPVIVVPENWSGTPHKVLVAVDTSSIAERVLREARLTIDDGDFSIVSVIDEPKFEWLSEVLGVSLSESEYERLEKVAKLGAAAGYDRDCVEILRKPLVGAAVLKEAERLEVDMIVVGTAGSGGVHRSLLGSAAGRILIDTDRPVVFVPARLGEVTVGWLSEAMNGPPPQPI